MAGRFVEMWRWQGKIDRKSYAIAGCSAFLLKFVLDKFVAFAWFGRSWFLWSYWQPLGAGARVNSMPPDSRGFVGTLLILAVAFILLGVELTGDPLPLAAEPFSPGSLSLVPATV